MWDKLRPIVSVVLALGLAFYLVACGGKVSKSSRINNFSISEVSPPPEIQRLNRSLDRYMPQVTILSPSSDQVLDTTEVKVQVAVKDLPIFKSELGLGNHIDVVLDERETRQIYDPNTPAQFDNVTPGTHTIRVFASRPWDESFKNEGAYAQTTFHVLTRTGEHVPRSDTPILTYHSPMGTVGSDTVLLDFYLHNAPVPPSLLDSREPSTWQIRATVNGESFTIEDWHSLYLKGLKPGRNWIKLEFLDSVGNPVPNITNSIAHIITYDPKQADTKSLLLQGQNIANIDQIVDPNYQPPTTPVPVNNPPENIPVPQETLPAAKPRFQLFKKKTKENPPTTPEQPIVLEEETKPIDSTETTPEQPIVSEEKAKPIDSTETTPEQPIVSEEETKPIDSSGEIIPPAAQEESPVKEVPTATEETPPLLKSEETKPQGRFQSLKARYQKIEQPPPQEVPDQL